jgi:hypothetical protein
MSSETSPKLDHSYEASALELPHAPARGRLKSAKSRPTDAALKATSNLSSISFPTISRVHSANSNFNCSGLGDLDSNQGAAAVNTKHQFLISSQLANQFNLDLDLARRRRAMRLHCLSLCHDAVVFQPRRAISDSPATSMSTSATTTSETIRRFR